MRDHHWKMCYEEAQALGFNEARAEALADLAAQNGKVHYAGFNPQQPRDEEGQWSEVGGFHVQTDSGGIIRKGGHVGLHGKHVSEVPGFLEQFKKEPAATTPAPAPPAPATPTQASPVAPVPSAPAAKPMKSPDELAKAMKQPQGAAPEIVSAAKAVKGIIDGIQNTDYAQIDAALEPLKALGADALNQVAAQNGMTLAEKTKGGRFEELRRRLRDRLGTWQRTLFRPPPDQHAESEPPDRYMDGRAMRQHHGKSVEHAVARLEVLAEGEADEEEIEGTVEGIARQFSKAELREVALAFGVHMTGTKGEVIERLIDKLSGE